MVNLKEYCVVIGDIVKSKQISNRKRVQTKFKESIEIINEKFKKEIVSNFLVTLGDEFQGVLKDSVMSYEIILKMEELMHPTNFVFGIGIGTITTDISEVALGMDGPAFHNARASLEEAKIDREHIYYKGFNKTQDISINTILSLLYIIKNLWTERQLEIVKLYRQEGIHQKVADRLKISQPAVAQALSAAHWSTIEKCEESLKKLLVR